MMREESMNRKQVMKQIVTDTQVSTGLFVIPATFVEHLPEKLRVDFLDVFDLEVKLLNGKTKELMFFWSEAMDVHEALTSWLAAQHEMGRCDCGSHHEHKERD